jgi:hypothetical protein
VVEGTTHGADREGVEWSGGKTAGGRFCSVFEFRGPLIARMMAAELTDEQSAMREMALEFARTKSAPFAGEWGAKKTLPLETLKEAAALGWAA